MKRLLPIFFCFLVFSFFSFSVSLAQNFTFDQAYKDYVYNYNLYRDSHLKYISSRGEYLSYKTLNAETKALEATREMLQKRAEALRTYLIALRLKLVETTGITNYQQNLIFVKLDSELGWLTAHKDSLSSPGSLADLVKVSGELEQKYPSLEVLIYQALGTILAGKENSLRERISQQTKKTEEKLVQIKKEGENVDKLERWLLETRRKITISEEKQGSAEAMIKKIKENDSDKRRLFNEAQFAFEEANQYLKEAVSFLNEINQEIKYE